VFGGVGGGGGGGGRPPPPPRACKGAHKYETNLGYAFLFFILTSYQTKNTNKLFVILEKQMSH
jgi:hypothetical protein